MEYGIDAFLKETALDLALMLARVMVPVLVRVSALVHSLRLVLAIMLALLHLFYQLALALVPSPCTLLNGSQFNSIQITEISSPI